MQKPDELAGRSLILLMDDLRLRRAAVESLLTLGPRASAPASNWSRCPARGRPNRLRHRAMILMNIDKVSIFRAGPDVSLRQFVDRGAGVPVVVMSNCDDPRAMARAFEAE